MAARFAAIGTTLAIITAFIAAPIYQRAVTLGLMRGEIVNILGHDLKIITNAVACEDLHYDVKSDLLYTACQGDIEPRSKWFPPMTLFDHTASDHQGHLALINPHTFKSTKINMEGFSGALCPHGIDIYTDPAESDSTYIFVINHMANPAYYSNPRTSNDRGLDRVEVFKHKIGEHKATYLRSVQHPLLRTTNDVVATSPTSFFITNDHYYREGFMRNIEEIGEHNTAAWSDISYVEFDEQKQPDAGVSVNTALKALHNNNGLGRGRPGHPEIVINDASGGRMYRARIDGSKLHVIEGIQMASALDNPFYYEDLYATPTNNASGYILPGYPRAYTFFGEWPDPAKEIPALVWHLRTDSAQKFEGKNRWQHRLVFQDDGKSIRSASGAVLIGIDPAKNNGKKQGWLYATGGAAKNMVALKIDL